MCRAKPKGNLGLDTGLGIIATMYIVGTLLGHLVKFQYGCGLQYHGVKASFLTLIIALWFWKRLCTEVL